VPARHEVRYTDHVATATRSEIVPIRVVGQFVSDDREKIVRAVDEWNLALNGFVRLELVPKGHPWVPGKTWSIVAVQGAPPTTTGRLPLAFAYAMPRGGGLVAVYVDRIGKRDLGGVVMHELGHVLGLGHDDRGGLMTAHYHPTAQQCVDKAAVQGVASRRGVPVGQLNWCQTNLASAR
jgi:hypothetical protein